MRIYDLFFSSRQEARRLSGVVFALLVAAQLPACATQLTVVPPLTQSAASWRSRAVRLEYDGRDEYVPRALRADANADLTARYSVDAQIERRDLPAGIVLYNPLTLFGFPTGSSIVNASGKLEMLRADGVVRQYQASATLRKRNHLYSADSLTLLRRSALLAVRDSVEAQLLNDMDALSVERSRATMDGSEVKGM
jgi:hypothetical protein